MVVRAALPSDFKEASLCDNNGVTDLQRAFYYYAVMMIGEPETRISYRFRDIDA